ncbi:Putative glycosyltransferase EpsE [Rubripirellula lacrimiformis]|uniref:Glycosyltransferase EpsE n=1 Tax=Rubripirellula lacrimiformis TaxID=1930273 RepID=A0A517N958_9BACT|nr:glycosyltransferase [Rubripirellula lacrimiformis]QDT03528.1 Putative glycosyltransferase EpsE [Rubripirellula lacrimiformis]
MPDNPNRAKDHEEGIKGTTQNTSSQERHWPSARTEEEIVNSWTQTQPVVSICCAAFNHESYIEETIRGFIEQVTTFPIEIILHDDASTDNTTDIIRRYAARYPSIIKTIIQTENQYSKGCRIMPEILLAEAKGDFLALCEGDDYWCNPQKLSMQTEAISASNACDLCFHPVHKVNSQTGEKEIGGQYSTMTTTVPAEEITLRPRGPIPTAATLITRRASLEIQQFFHGTSGLTVSDIFIHAIAAEHGGAVYLPEPMATYRVFTPNSWSDRYSDHEVRMENAIAHCNGYRELAATLLSRQSDTLRETRRRLVCRMIKEPGGSKRARVQLLSKNRDCFGTREFAVLHAVSQSRTLLALSRLGASLRRSIYRKPTL